MHVAAEMSHSADHQAYEEALNHHMGATFDHYVAELARRLPEFAPSIFALREQPGYNDKLCCLEPTTPVGQA